MFRLIALATIALAAADRFNYDQTSGNNYGPGDWNQVQCSDIDTCPGWPTNWEDINPFLPYDQSINKCHDCSDSTQGECKGHSQTPIYLNKDVVFERDCRDRHRMNIVKGDCAFPELEFEILPHVLRVKQPETCAQNAEIDFSRGFPIPWVLSFTDLSTPSQHVIDGERFDAELVLSHTYKRDIEERYIGNVAVFFKVVDNSTTYDLLDVYLDRWEEVAEEVAENCAAVSGTNARRGLRNPGPSNARARRAFSTNEELSDFLDRDYHPYDFYKSTNTEYYFRYVGSVPEPPCFEGVHWRVLKDPVPISPAQLQRIKDLLANRINPTSCEPETAAKVTPVPGKPDDVSVSRPLQTTTREHQLVFCECTQWDSRTDEDIAWCELPFEVRIGLPTDAPSAHPSDVPSDSPSLAPSSSPSVSPSMNPSASPSMAPSTSPSLSPSTAPSTTPSGAPSASPTSTPLVAPTGTSFDPITDGESSVGKGKRKKTAIIVPTVVLACVVVAVVGGVAYHWTKTRGP